ncbi:MAG: hypothetical protein JST35_06100 [Armatimonadetes bacterium]|jgi:hypothetical protein|nr:hypothetical protein [Armatimonadota bacterium]
MKGSFTERLLLLTLAAEDAASHENWDELAAVLATREGVIARMEMDGEELAPETMESVRTVEARIQGHLARVRQDAYAEMRKVLSAVAASSRLHQSDPQSSFEAAG